MKTVAEAVRMAFCSELCADCRMGPIPQEAKFCPYCGKKLPDISIVDEQYRTLSGWWLISTEKGDGEWNILGVYEGAVVDLAFKLRSMAMRTLQFQAIQKPKVKLNESNSVDVSFPTEIALARTDKGSRARLVRTILHSSGVDGIEVSESVELGAVTLTKIDADK